jgi:hypothetical protein
MAPAPTPPGLGVPGSASMGLVALATGCVAAVLIPAHPAPPASHVHSRISGMSSP